MRLKKKNPDENLTPSLRSSAFEQLGHAYNY